MDVGLVALSVGALLTAGIGASLLAGRLRLPGLVLVLVLGMVLGSDGLEWINFGQSNADYDVAQNAAILALALILYEGGLSSGWAEIKPVIRVSVLLATAGTAITAGITAVAAALLFTARPWPRPMPPRSSRCCADRRCGASSPARSRASPVSTTRSPSCW
jgi:cell volume regulation protein A